MTNGSEDVQMLLIDLIILMGLESSRFGMNYSPHAHRSPPSGENTPGVLMIGHFGIK